jgi:hypothetical protein
MTIGKAVGVVDYEMPMWQSPVCTNTLSPSWPNLIFEVYPIFHCPQSIDHE